MEHLYRRQNISESRLRAVEKDHKGLGVWVFDLVFSLVIMFYGF